MVVRNESMYRLHSFRFSIAGSSSEYACLMYVVVSLSYAINGFSSRLIVANELTESMVVFMKSRLFIVC